MSTTATTSPATPTPIPLTPPTTRVYDKTHIIMLVMFVVLVVLVVLLYKCKMGSVVAAAVIGQGPTRLFLSDPEYTSLKNNHKTVDARVDRPPFNNLSEGDDVIIVRSRPHGDTSEYPGGEYKFKAEVTARNEYKNIKELLKEEGLKKVYPDRTEKEAIEAFNKYLPKDHKSDEKVLALHLKRV